MHSAATPATRDSRKAQGRERGRAGACGVAIKWWKGSGSGEWGGKRARGIAGGWLAGIASAASVRSALVHYWSSWFVVRGRDRGRLHELVRSSRIQILKLNSGIIITRQVTAFASLSRLIFNIDRTVRRTDGRWLTDIEVRVNWSLSRKPAWVSLDVHLSVVNYCVCDEFKVNNARFSVTVFTFHHRHRYRFARRIHQIPEDFFSESEWLSASRKFNERVCTIFFSDTRGLWNICLMWCVRVIMPADAKHYFAPRDIIGLTLLSNKISSNVLGK